MHPATGGDGLAACSGDMLLEALAACAGVTLRAVATALDIPLQSGTVNVEGDLDFRGTLGVAKDEPVGFKEIRLRFDLDTAGSRRAGGEINQPNRALLRRVSNAAPAAADQDRNIAILFAFIGGRSLFRLFH